MIRPFNQLARKPIRFVFGLFVIVYATAYLLYALGMGQPLAWLIDPVAALLVIGLASLAYCVAYSRGGLVVLPVYWWLTLFFAIPFLFVLKISVATSIIAAPPYTPLATWNNDTGDLQLHFHIKNYLFLFSDLLYIKAYLSSIKIAFISTVLCLLIGYPVAYFIARAKSSTRSLLLMLVILPSWTSFLIRIYAWVGILKTNGTLNELLLWVGIIDTPLKLLHTPIAVYIGIVYAYLPFMVLPLYANLVKLDGRLLEAAADLGAKPITSFFSITLPLSKGGIIAGCMLVFIPAIGEYVIPELLGGPGTLMIGKVMWTEFFGNRDWPVASAVAMVMLFILILPIYWYRNTEMKNLERAKNG